VVTPDELLNSSPVFTSLDVTVDEIRERIQEALDEEEITWASGFVLTLRGNFTTVATPGILTGQLTVGTNIGFGDGNISIKYFGRGSVDIWGIPLGEAAALLDLSDLLNPQLDFAAALPSPRNPLGFLFPAEGTFSIRLRTTGIIEAPMLALGIFIDEGSRGVLGVAQQAFGQVIDRFALDLQQERDPILARLFRDTNGDDELSELESSRTIDGEFVLSRLLGNASLGLSPILAISTATFDSDQVERTGEITSLILADLLDAAQRTSLGLDAVTALLDVLERAAGDAIAAGWAVFNPELAIKGLLQPQILGFPLGPASERLEIILSKSGLSFAYQTSLIEMVKRSLAIVPGLTELATLMSLGFSDLVELGYTLNFPDVGRFANILARGTDGLTDLADFIVDTINPFSNWEVLISGQFLTMGFRLVEVNGLIFAPQLDDNGNFLPSGLFASRVINLDPDGDERPNEDLAESAAQINGVIPINKKSEYENMMRFGGVVLTGQLFLPKILRDPVELFTEDINWNLPDSTASDPLQIPAVLTAYQQWLEAFVTELTKDAVWARLQVYLPSPAELFDLGDYLSDDPQSNTLGGGDSGAPEIRSTAKVRPLDQVLTTKITEIFNAAFVEGFVEVQLFSIDFGRAEISASATGLNVTASVPWLSGLTPTFQINREPQNLNSVIRDIVGSPLVGRLVEPFLAPGQTAAQAFSLLLDPRLPQINFDLPVAGVEILVDSEALSEWLTDSFGLPAHLFQNSAGGPSEITFGAFTPGFGGPGAIGVERYGGFRLDAHLNITGLVQNADFHFEVELFNFDNPASFLFPNFVASASVTSLSAPGLQSSPGLLELSNFLVEIARTSAGVEIGLGGQLLLLGSLRFVTVGRFAVDLAPGGGIFGEVQLLVSGSMAPNATLNGNMYQLNGSFFLQVNTTGTPKTIELPGVPPADYPVVARESAQLRASGSLTVGGFSLNGFFLLSRRWH
jgi:hypothetical protein